MTVSIKHPTNQPNFTKVEVGGLTLWFSYETIIGFEDAGVRKISENLWSTTTGKHLNELGPKTDRVERSLFEAMLQDALNDHHL